MDIGTIKSGNTTVKIKHPASMEPTGLEIELRPMFSPEVKAVTRRIKDQALKLGQRGKTFTSDDIDKNTTDILVAAVANFKFTGDAKWHGETPKFDQKIVREMVAIDWLAAQLDEALGDTSSFFRI
jgi:hypothetical protein